VVRIQHDDRKEHEEKWLPAVSTASAVGEITSPGLCGKEMTDRVPAALPIWGQPSSDTAAKSRGTAAAMLFG
jgi:hypothetical protein